VPEISPVLEVVEDFLLFGADGWREGLDGAVDRDGGRAQRWQRLCALPAPA